MRRLLKWAAYGVLALVAIALIGGFLYREELARLNAVNTLFDEDRIVQNFSNMNAAFLTVPVPRGDGPVMPLPVGDTLSLPASVAAWVEETDLTALAVLDRGQLVYENTYRGTAPEDRRIAWSITKSFVSILIGISEERGELTLDDPVTDHAPALRGGAYDDLTVHDVLTMQSGVTFDEDYLDPRSDINRMGRIIALGGTMDGFAAGLTERDRPAGQEWEYVSIDTHVLAMLLRGATGQSLAPLMGERLIALLGFEAEPYLLADGEGVAFALGGLNLTLRDTLRFGLMVALDGQMGDTQIVSTDWIERSTTPQAKTAEGKIQYGYQWWIPWNPWPGEVFARGVYGQWLYIDKDRDIVIAATAADRRFREDGRYTLGLTALRTLADAAVAAR